MAWQSVRQSSEPPAARRIANVIAPAADVMVNYADAQMNVRTYGTNYFIAGTGALQFWMQMGSVKLVGAGGLIKLQFAQQTPEVSNTSLYPGSYLILRRLG